MERVNMEKIMEDPKQKLYDEIREHKKEIEKITKLNKEINQIILKLIIKIDQKIKMNI